MADRIELKPENYAVDKNYPNVVYIPETAYFDINKNNISWEYKGKEQHLILSPFKTYIHPSKQIKSLLYTNGFEEVHTSIKFPWNIQLYKRIAS